MITVFVEERNDEVWMNWRLKEAIVIQVWDDECPEQGDMKWECSENEKEKRRQESDGKIWEKQSGIIYWQGNLVFKLHIVFFFFPSVQVIFSSGLISSVKGCGQVQV